MKNSTQVLIHSPANFPYVRERGFLVGLGQEVNVQVDATGKSRYFGLLYQKFCIFWNGVSNIYHSHFRCFFHLLNTRCRSKQTKLSVLR